MSQRVVPVLEIGGSHVTAGTVTWEDAVTVDVAAVRPLDPRGSRDAIVGAFLAAGGAVAAPVGATWGVACPSPFDYARGIALFTYAEVGKFEAIHGVDLRQAFLEGLPGRPAGVVFLNDADAFGIGEAATGAGAGFGRVVCFTLGSGVGSAFVDRGRSVNSGAAVPPEGRIHLTRFRGRPLEDTVSRRAIRRRHAEAGGGPADVREIADRARAGDATAARVFTDCLTDLGLAVGPWCAAFGAEAVVVGGSIARSWDLVAPALTRGLAQAERPWSGPVLQAGPGTDSQLVGTALAVVDKVAV
jgi:glucokinase